MSGRAYALLLACLLIPMASCSAGLGEDAGDLVALDTTYVLEKAAPIVGAPSAVPTVLINTPSPCPNGSSEHRRVVARLAVAGGASLDATFERATHALTALIADRGYRLTSTSSSTSAPRSRMFTMTRDAPPARMEVRLRGGKQPYIELDSEIPCTL